MKIKLLKSNKNSFNNFINQMPGYILIKDLNSRYLTANTRGINFLGFKDLEELTGKTDYEVKHECVKYADFFITQDNNLKLTGQAISTFNVFQFNKKFDYPVLINKSILTDEENQKYGILAHTTEITNKLLNDFFTKLSKLDHKYTTYDRKSYCLNSNYPNITLSNRQSQCLFYILRGKSASFIAKILNLSTRTVESHVEELKNKMSCNSKSQLIEKALALGYLDNIPPGII